MQFFDERFQDLSLLFRGKSHADAELLDSSLVFSAQLSEAEGNVVFRQLPLTKYIDE